MIGLIMSALIYFIPFAAIVFFVVSLCNYISAKKQYKAEPNDLNTQKKNTTKTLLIVSSLIMGVLVTVIVAFVALMFTAVAFM